MLVKLFTLMLIAMIFQSCAALSKSKKACSIVVKGSPMISEKIGNYVMGNIFQLGDCAISQSLRIELGDFVSFRKGAIRTELNYDSYVEKENIMTLFELFGCDLTDKNKYFDFTKNQLARIFLEDSKLTGREMMLYVRYRIKEDVDMNAMCFH